MAIQEPFHESGFQKWRLRYPCLHLLRVPGIAAGWSILLVGFVSCYLIMTLDVLLVGFTSITTAPTIDSLLLAPAGTFLAAFSPVVDLYSLATIFFLGQSSIFTADLVWTMLVHIVGGLIMTRLAAQKFATGQGGGLENACGFAVVKLPALAVGLMFPLLAMSMLYGLCYVCLRIEWIPAIGPWLAGILYGPGLLLMFLAILFLAGILFGWPMMVAALATEKSDGFDIWSRTFDYVRSRLLSITLLSGLAITLGLIGLSVAGELSELAFRTIDQMQANLLKQPAEAIELRNEATFQQGPIGFQNLWRTLWLCLLHGYFLTLFWTTMAGVYNVTRYSVDRIPVREFKG